MRRNKNIPLLTHRYEVEVLGEERSVTRNIINRAGHRRCRSRNYVHFETQCCNWETAPDSSTFISRSRSGNAAAVLVVEFFR